MIQEPCSFIVWGGPDESGFQTCSLSYSLFSSQKLKGEDSLLWSINQPLLEKALQKWEKQSGHVIDVVQGNSKDVSLYRHGFKKPVPEGAKPSFEEELPNVSEEEIPDLDELDL